MTRSLAQALSDQKNYVSLEVNSFRHFLIPVILVSFALISLITLKSLAPDLATSQLIFWLIGGGAFVIFSHIKINFFRRHHWWAYGVLLSLLVIVLITGTVTRGSARWFSFGDLFAIQPSQLAVPVVGLSLAFFSSRFTLKRNKFLVSYLMILALPALLILIEPDLGTTLHLVFSVGVILWLSEIRIRQLLSLLGLALAGGLLAWILVIKPYQKARIASFLTARTDQTQETNYNAFQSQIAVGSGELYGKGIGQGSQSHLRFLPERQTDFIFASFAEEWGFLGASILLSLYLILCVYLIYRARLAPNKFSAFYLMVTMTAIAFQAFVNIGMNIGVLPITGITLPFISYGGSSLVSLCIMLGISQNLILRQQRKMVLDIR